MDPVLISPSILSADFSNLAAAAQMMETAGADWLHVDVMDGHFVPNITIGPVVVKSLRARTRLPFDVHLMITDPMRYAEDFKKAGASSLTFHFEAVRYPEVVIKHIRSLGCGVGMSIKPDTPGHLAAPYLADLDLLLVMTVEPGFGGQSFMAEQMPKVNEVADLIKSRGLNCRLEVDGGINAETAKTAVAAGADVLVAGNAIFNAPDPAAAVRALKSISV